MRQQSAKEGGGGSLQWAAGLSRMPVPSVGCQEGGGITMGE